MTSCLDGVCGTGSDTAAPLPSDPNNSSVLTASTVFGGIEANWTLPSVNAHAVAYTLFYAGNSNDFTAAIEREVIGNSYFDRIDADLPVTRYYWIKLVSINGTVGELVGPAMATSSPVSQDMLDALSQQIDSGVLAQALRARIDQIELLSSDLQQEITDRQTGTVTLSQAIQQAKDGTAAAMTFMQQESANRVDQDGVLAEQLNVVAATADSNLAAVQTDIQTKINTANGRIDTVASQVTQAAAQSATNLATAQSTLQGEINAANGRIDTVSTAVTTAQTTAANNLASVQQTLQTNINTVDGKTVGIGARWTALVDVNGLVGGFGVYNDGRQVQAGFNVDTFWVGRPDAGGQYPFIVSNGVVYMNSAFFQAASIKNAHIDNAAVDTLKVAGGAITAAAFVSDGEGNPTAYDLSMVYTLNGVPGEAYDVFILGTMVQSYQSRITMQINGAQKWSEIPLGGTLATKGIVVHLAPGTYTIRLFSDDFRNVNGSSLYVLATKR